MVFEYKFDIGNFRELDFLVSQPSHHESNFVDHIITPFHVIEVWFMKCGGSHVNKLDKVVLSET